jgi:tRNA(Arg) A34 adenosine deaminase TadA
MNGKQSQQLATACEIRLPQWLPGFLAEWDGELDTVEGRMALTIALSRQNVERSRGGPFAAVVYDLDGGSLVAAGVNLVTALNLSCAHAEIVALSLAQHAEKTWNLGERGSMELVTSCEPCAMCFGAVPWSGIRRLVCGGRKEDAEKAGFDEGDKPPAWRESLAARGIEVLCDVRRDDAASVFDYYIENAGTIYNP